MFLPAFFILLVLATFRVQGDPTCPAKDGEYPVYIPHKDCTKFWECSNGTPYLFNCPADLHFNPKLNVCDWPDRAGCNGSDGDDKSSESSDSSSSSDSVENEKKI